jgi:hypothetical protein
VDNSDHFKLSMEVFEVVGRQLAHAYYVFTIKTLA